MDFKKFKANRGKSKEAAKKMIEQKPVFTDERFWELAKDKAGNGEAIIRFLSQPKQESEPIVLKFTHGFKENGKWFFEDCPVTIGKECPSCNYAQPYWDEGTKESKAIASRYWRKKQFFANILVVKDVANPENNGKVFLFKFGKKIYDKIMTKVNPESQLDEPVWIFDLWEGLNFKIKVKKVSDWPNYDDSEWYTTPIPVAETDDEIEKIYNEMRFLDEFTDPKNFKSYEEIEKKFYSIVKSDKPAPRTTTPEESTQKTSESDTETSEKTPEDTGDTKFDEESDSKSKEKTEEKKDVSNSNGDKEVDFDENEFDFDSLTDDDFSFDE